MTGTALRSAATLSLVLLLTVTAACGDDTNSSTRAACSAMSEVVGALSRVRAAEEDTGDVAAAFETGAGAFERTLAPAELDEEWIVAADALRYYGASAGAEAAGRGDEVPRRSQAEVQTWQLAFGRITAFGVDSCNLGWRTAFDDCRGGSPPADADETRLLFPCRD